jgi:cell division septum initiation protein DivIVA
MTKQEEMDAWERFASAMPVESYSKGALYSLLMEVSHALSSDHIPTLCIADANSRAVRIVMDAEAKAAKLLQQAKVQADEMIEAATVQAERLENSVHFRKLELIKHLQSL